MGETDQEDISSVEWSNIGTIILCRFRRTLEGNGNLTIDKDLSTGQYYMFFADGDTIGKHLMHDSFQSGQRLY